MCGTDNTHTSFELRSTHRMDGWLCATLLAGYSGVISPILRAWACTCLLEHVCVCLRKVPGAHFQLYEIPLNGHRLGALLCSSLLQCQGSPLVKSRGHPSALSALTLAHQAHPCFSCFLYKHLHLQTRFAGCAQLLRRDSHLGREEMRPRRVLSGQRDVLKAFRI